MAFLIEEADEDVIGDRVKVVGPASIFVEGDLGSGTVTIFASRSETSEEVEVLQANDPGVFTDSIHGTHWLSAILGDSTDPDCSVFVR